MKRLLYIALGSLMLLLIAGAAASRFQDRADSESVRGRLIGAWRLAWIEEQGADERSHHVTHHVEGALVRTLIGKELTRIYEFSGKQLILKSSRQDEHWTIAWEHY